MDERTATGYDLGGERVAFASVLCLMLAAAALVTTGASRIVCAFLAAAFGAFAFAFVTWSVDPRARFANRGFRTVGVAVTSTRVAASVALAGASAMLHASRSAPGARLPEGPPPDADEEAFDE